MKKGLWLAASSLVVMALLAGACAKAEIEPPAVPTRFRLTACEKEKVIDMALNTGVALAYLDTESEYRVQLNWIAICWEDSEPVKWHVLSYELEPDEVYEFVPESAVIYPGVHIWFGEPRRWVVMVAVDLETEKVVLVDSYPVRTGPPPPKDGN